MKSHEIHNPHFLMFKSHFSPEHPHLFPGVFQVIWPSDAADMRWTPAVWRRPCRPPRAWHAPRSLPRCRRGRRSGTQTDMAIWPWRFRKNSGKCQRYLRMTFLLIFIFHLFGRWYLGLSLHPRGVNVAGGKWRIAQMNPNDTCMLERTLIFESRTHGSIFSYP